MEKKVKQFGISLQSVWKYQRSRASHMRKYQSSLVFAPVHSVDSWLDDERAGDGMPWEFKPMVREIEMRIGETGLVFYEAYNPTGRAVAGQASYNVAPYQAGYFFNKIACFCFEEQVLQPGERVEMPVTFYVDPEIVTDRDAKYTQEITLSYTFYEIDLPEEVAQAALEQPADTINN